VSAPRTDIVPGLYAAFASVVLFVIVTAVFVGAASAAWAGVGLGVVGSTLVGYHSVRRGLATPAVGAWQYARPWLWFVAWAAVGLYDGRYLPLFYSMGLAAGMSVAYLLGGLAAGAGRR
jgi:hypothetical protein